MKRSTESRQCVVFLGLFQRRDCVELCRWSLRACMTIEGASTEATQSGVCGWEAGGGLDGTKELKRTARAPLSTLHSTDTSVLREDAEESDTRCWCEAKHSYRQRANQPALRESDGTPTGMLETLEHLATVCRLLKWMLDVVDGLAHSDTL